jgi:nucleotide-binding universal stress UspA family protein
MSYKTIMVHVGVDPAAEARVSAAAALGRRYGSTIVGVGAIAWDPYIDPTLGYADGETIQALRNDVDIDILTAEATFKAACAGYPHPTQWRPVVDYPARTMLAMAGGTDLIVASRPQKNHDDRRFAAPVDLVMESGVPVMLLGPEPEAVSHGEVVIGWKNTRETRRAVGDALPLLKSAEWVHVAHVCEDVPAEEMKAELDDVVARLKRHGVQAGWETAPRRRETVAQDLADLFSMRMADVLVLGAYGHSRLREWAFGGVTRDLLEIGRKTILFSH